MHEPPGALVGDKEDHEDMRLDALGLLCATAILLLAVASQGRAARSNRTILFGVNYVGYVHCVEDFSPYWSVDNWTPKRLITDLKIMKAIGCLNVRFHVYPGMTSKTWPSEPSGERLVSMLDLAVDTAKDLGMKFHLDMTWDDTYARESVEFFLKRYRGRIEAYQIGNEQYQWPSEPGKLEWLQGLVELAHSLDPKAKVSADILVPDWVNIRKNMPELYRQLDLNLAHYYPVTDFRGWNDIYIADLLDHLGNPTGRKSVAEISKELYPKILKEFGEYEAKSTSYDHPLYEGSYGWLDKELWLSETGTYGYAMYANVVPEPKRATDWVKVVDAIAAAKNRVTRISHYCFRDKISWRGWGEIQCGIVYYDGAPRAATFAFKKMAVKYSPPDSAMRVVDCEIERVAVPEGANAVELKIKLTNKTTKVLSGEALLELPGNATTKNARLDFSLPAERAKVLKTQVDVSNMTWGNNHVFARVKVPQGLIYGWGVIAKPKRMKIDTTPVLNKALSAKVRYVQGFEAVQEFLDKYGDDCSIQIGPCLGGDSEMGYRLKLIIQAMRCREVPLKPNVLAIEALNRPIIVIGTPEYNLISRTIEMGLPPEQRVTSTNPGPGKGVIMVVNEPLGERSISGRGSRQAIQVGCYFGGCPAALYLAGPDDEGTQAAVYDLILRIWGDDSKYD